MVSEQVGMQGWQGERREQEDRALVLDFCFLLIDVFEGV